MKVFIFVILIVSNLLSDKWKCTILSNAGATQLSLDANNGQVKILDEDGLVTNYNNPYDNKGVLQYDSVEFNDIGLDMALVTKDKIEIAFYKKGEITAGGNCFRDVSK